MTTCEVPAAEPIRGAQACADLVARLPRPEVRGRARLIARSWSATVAWLRALRMSRTDGMPRADVRRDARPDPAAAREAASHYLATHWVNR
jgi:hypothetical protein